MIGADIAVVLADLDLVAAGSFNDTVSLGNHHNAAVDGSLVFHTGADDRTFGHHKRHSLLLHVGTHERTGVVVVFKERDHSRGDRNHHFRRYIHVVNAFFFDLRDFFTDTDGNAVVDETAGLVERLVCLGDDIFVFDVGGHVDDLVGDDAGGFVHLAVGCFDKAEFIDFRVGCKI